MYQQLWLEMFGAEETMRARFPMLSMTSCRELTPFTTHLTQPIDDVAQ